MGRYSNEFKKTMVKKLLMPARAVGDGALEVIRGERIDALALAAGDS
jgi:transposase-like protein